MEANNVRAMRGALENLVYNIELRASVFDIFSIIDRKTWLDAKAADTLAAHSVPDWVAHRLATFKAEATSLADALSEHQKEHKENQQ